MFCAAIVSGALFLIMPKSSASSNASTTHTFARHTVQSGGVESLQNNEQVKRASEWLAKNSSWITDEQVRITEIPAPPFEEANRAAYMKKAMMACGLAVRTDEVGNVIGERAGMGGAETVLITAHLDTVFPAGTDVRVRRESGLLYAPGVADNGTGLATLVGLARALQETKLKTRLRIVFAADVGEEGEGNLRGVRKLVEEYSGKLSAVIALDGASTDYVVTQALASRRVEFIVTGPGGHSWTDFGAPNAINALARGISQFLKTIHVSGTPRTTFNIGTIEGGASVNAIPARAAIKVDIRSERETEIGRVEAALRDAIRDGIREEAASSTARGGASAGGGGLELQSEVLGVRPGGELPPNSPLLMSLKEADRFLGNQSRIERSSTDANIPLSLGIPALALGCGGRAGGAHTTGEWYDPAGREMGLHRVLLTLLGAAGVEK
jgi:tripeptide aminopeptidase